MNEAREILSEETVERLALAMAGAPEWNDYPAPARRFHTEQARVALASPEVAEWRRKAEVYDRIAEIVGDSLSPVVPASGARSVRYDRIAHLIETAS